jgi:hypothetical protein
MGEESTRRQLFELEDRVEIEKDGIKHGNILIIFGGWT